MRKAIAILSSTLLPALLLGGTAVSRPAPFVPPAGCDLFHRLPILQVDVSGSTLLGPYHSHLSVYGDGSLSYYPPQGAAGDDPLLVKSLSGEELDELRQGLVDAGAFDFCDQSQNVTDLPLTTVTVFGPEKTTRAHTFSYWIGSGAYQRIGAILNDLTAAD